MTKIVSPMNSYFNNTLFALVTLFVAISASLFPQRGLAQESAVEAFEAQLLGPTNVDQASSKGTVHASLADGELKLIVGFNGVSSHENEIIGSHLYRGNPLENGTHVQNLAVALAPTGGFEATIQMTPELEADLRAGLLYVLTRTENVSPTQTVSGQLLAANSTNYFETQLSLFSQGSPASRGAMRAMVVDNGLRLVGFFNKLGSNWTRISIYLGEQGKEGQFFAWLWNYEGGTVYGGIDKIIPALTFDWQTALEAGHVSIVIETSRSSDMLYGRMRTRTNQAPPASQVLDPVNGSVVVIGGSEGEDPVAPDYFLGAVTLDKVDDPDGDPVSYLWQLSTRPGFSDERYLATIDLGVDSTVVRLSVASAAAIFDSLAANEPGGVPFQTPVTVFHRVVTTDGSRYTVGPVTETTFVRGTITSNEPDPEAPVALKLRGNYPNPFADATTVTFDLPATSDVRLEVFDLLGRNVVTVDAGQMSGTNGAIDVDGSSLPNGTYLYRVTARAARGVSMATGSMVLMR